jgi:hypothetical protein
MSKASDIDLQMMKIALRDYPGNGKPDPNDSGTILLRKYGLIEEQVQNKRCQACGTERPDYHWFKITPAGRLFMQLAGISHE